MSSKIRRAGDREEFPDIAWEGWSTEATDRGAIVMVEPDRPQSDVAEQLRASFENWRDEVRTRRQLRSGAADVAAPQFYFIDVSLQSITDEDERNRFQSIPTALTLDAATVDRLRAVARQLLLQSPDFKRLVEDLGN